MPICMMIVWLTLNGLYLQALNCFLCIKDEGIVPNISTLVSVLKVVVQVGYICRDKDVEAFASKLGLT